MNRETTPEFINPWKLIVEFWHSSIWSQNLVMRIPKSLIWGRRNESIEIPQHLHSLDWVLFKFHHAHDKQVALLSGYACKNSQGQNVKF